MTEPIFPIESKSAEIGRHAVLCFNGQVPTDWIPHDMGGPGDFGIDFDVQVKVGNQVRYRFRAQVKGSENDQSMNHVNGWSLL